MMLVVLVVLVNCFSFVVGDPTEPTLPGDADYEGTKKLIDENIPVKDGKFDPSKFSPIKSKAEERIDGINEWLDGNVGWMRFIFYMRPQISWLFAFNVYFILFFLVAFVLNASSIWIFI